MIDLAPKPPRSSPTLFGFLGELAKNNNRDWFQANKARYESDVQGADASASSPTSRPDSLSKSASAFVVDARPVGGSLMRVYRDTRFSKDKTPYKTNVGGLVHHHRRPRR